MAASVVLLYSERWPIYIVIVFFIQLAYTKFREYFR